MKKNFQITAVEDNKKYWISPSPAVCVIPIIQSNDGFKLIIQKRGPGCPTEVGKWAFTCGYLEFEQRPTECAVSELWQELGIRVDEKDIRFFGFSDPRKDPNLNITARFYTIIPEKKIKFWVPNFNTKSRGGEEDEVSDIKIIGEDEIKDYTWAFNHDELYQEFLDSEIDVMSVQGVYAVSCSYQKINEKDGKNYNHLGTSLVQAHSSYEAKGWMMEKMKSQGITVIDNNLLITVCKVSYDEITKIEEEEE